MSANHDIERVREAIEGHLDIDCVCPDSAAKAAILAMLDLLFGETVGSGTGAYIKAKRDQIRSMG